MVALHMMLTKLPKRVQDAAMLVRLEEGSPGSSPSRATNDMKEPATTNASSLKLLVTNERLEIQYTHVLEVLKDECPDIDSWLEIGVEDSHGRRDTSTATKAKRPKSRTQRWAPFDISRDGVELINAFDCNGTHNEKRSGLGQTHIVKQFPFGRRV